MFKEFRGAETLADGFIFGLACAKAGIPVLLVAPPSGGKSTIISACNMWLERNKIKTLKASRISLRTLREIASELVRNKEVVIINDDYSDIGDSDYIQRKMGEIISELSYSRGYHDYGLKVTISIKKLGFISGVQPLWIKTMFSSRVFATNIREKFIRYYILPFKPTKDLREQKAVELLVNNQPTYNQTEEVEIPSIFIDSLALQVGRTRAGEFADRLVEALKSLVPIWKIPKLLRFFSIRLGFENLLVDRSLGDYTYHIEVAWKGHTVLFWCLRRGALEREDLLELLGVSSLRSVDRAIEEAFIKGWIIETPTRNRKYMANYNIFRGFKS